MPLVGSILIGCGAFGSCAGWGDGSGIEMTLEAESLLKTTAPDGRI